MTTRGSTPGPGVVPVDEFVRLLKGRGRDLHWLLGAGVSWSAGVPTAADLIYQFKALLYAQYERVRRSSLDSRSPDLRDLLDGYFSRLSEFPTPGHPEEYAAFFEAAYPNARDRRDEIDRVLRENDPTPRFGHVVLAGMWRMGLLHCVWTTNFDSVMDDAAAAVSGRSGWLTMAQLETAAQAVQFMSDPSRPLLVKMHGDFRSERLDNIGSELQDANNKLRALLAETVRTRGLVVVGYSGRDGSVMDALDRALSADNPYPAGLFWVKRPGSPVLDRVTHLMSAAAAKGVDARFVECASFEELLTEVELLLEPDDKLRAVFDRFQPADRRAAFERPARGGRWPKLRLNALAVAAYPRTARLVEGSDLGGGRRVREAVEKAGVDVVVARRFDGVVAFGEDADLLRAFAYADPTLDWADIDPFRGRQDSSTMGFLYAALVRSLARDTGLIEVRRRSERILYVDPAISGQARYEPLRKAVGGRVTGTIPASNGGGGWHEGIRVRLEHRYGSLWLITTPLVWRERSEDKVKDDARREWCRQRQVGRFNRQYTALLKAWSNVLCPGPPEVKIRCFGRVDTGANAEFTLKRLAPFVERLAS